MTTLFADSFFYFTLLSKNDAMHSRAVEHARGFRGRIVTTEWVLTEVADGLASEKIATCFWLCWSS